MILHNTFIHYVDLYSASSRLLIRSAPDSSMAKKSSFKARAECIRVNPGNNHSANGSPFQTEGPTTENARVWRVEVRTKGTPRSIDWRELRPLVPRVREQRSRR